MQLAVHDMIFSESKTKNLIDKCRNVCKKLRTPNRKILIQKFGLRKSIIDCPTRWNYIFDMIQRLLEFKNFCTDIMDSDLHLDNETWEFCTYFVNIFKPVKQLTLQLQSEQMTLGDFYGLWLRFKLDMKNNESNAHNLAQKLYSNIIKREENFINTLVIYCLLPFI